jgi:hypothetical protein
MALFKYIGPEAEVRLSVAGHEIGNCERGGSIVVPDELAELVVFPEEHWEPAGKKANESERKDSPVGKRNVSSANSPAGAEGEGA